MMKLIVCYDIGEFREYCNQHKINPHDPKDVKWIRNRIDMLGFHDDVEVVFYGTYYRLKDFHDIEIEANRIKSLRAITRHPAIEKTK